uniref:Uncharacterized protein n=1 Tax=Strongyloides papillosus TaxID=174720 RepID=A0A0N5BQB8_STREA
MEDSNKNENILIIPNCLGGTTIVCPVSTLPEVDVIISELSGEHCTPDIWYDFAIAYYCLKELVKLIII